MSFALLFSWCLPSLLSYLFFLPPISQDSLSSEGGIDGDIHIELCGPKSFSLQNVCLWASFLFPSTAGGSLSDDWHLLLKSLSTKVLTLTLLTLRILRVEAIILCFFLPL